VSYVLIVWFCIPGDCLPERIPGLTYQQCKSEKWIALNQWDAVAAECQPRIVRLY
jgi:hypothetical protein